MATSALTGAAESQKVPLARPPRLADAFVLTLRVLGTLNLRDENGHDLPAALAQPKRAALLSYLCVRAPAGYCRRDTLLALFWPEADEEHARTALRGALYFLRRTVGEDVIRTRGDDVGVDPNRLTCDATLFERAVAEGQLDDALLLYGGDLLDGVHVADASEFEEWRDNERGRLRRAAIDAAKALAARRDAEGDLSGAIHAARRATTLVPDDETVAQCLMMLLDRAGDRAGALRAYDELSARLLGSYQSAPSPETRALVEAIRQRDRVAASAVASRRDTPVDARPEELRDRPRADETTRVGAETPDVVMVNGSLGAHRGPTRAQMTLVVAGASLAALAAFAGVSSFRARNGLTTSPSSPDVVVVLPFTYNGARTLSYLGDGMGRLLTTNLNGAGTLRIIDPVAVQRAVDREARGASATGIDSAQMRHVADRFGAGLVVTGQVSEAGGRLRVTADVIARGHSTSQIVVDGTSDRLFELVDELTARLVAAWGTEKGQRFTSLAARTTHSLPALRAYLDGEREFAAGRYALAVDAYQRAVGADSTFALAYYRLSSALTWTTLPDARTATRQARRFIGRLSRRDAMLVEARYANSNGMPDDAVKLYRALLADYPEEIEAWYQLGEVQYHWAATLGRSAQISQAAFERALALDPVHLPALVHLARLAAAPRRVARLDSLRARLAPLAMGLEESLELDALRWFTGESSAERMRVVTNLSALGTRRVGRMLPALASSTEDLGAVLAIVRALDAQERDAAADVRIILFGAELELARGRWRAANTALDRVAEQSPSVAAQYRGAFAAATWFPIGAEELTRVRAAVAREPAVAGSPGLQHFVDPKSGLFPEQRAYVLARLSARAGDSSAALRALEDARAGGPLAADPDAIATLTQQIRAQLLARRGRADEALRLVGGRVLPVATSLPTLPSFRTADARFLRAELLRMVGRDDDALAMYATFPDPNGYDLMYLAPAHLRQAEILDRRGDRAAARAHFQRFVALWAECDPELRPQVDAVRRRLAALGL